MNSHANTTQPKIAITMGDPGGIGPEIIIKSLAVESVKKLCRPIVFGDIAILQKTAARLALPVSFRKITSPSDEAANDGTNPAAVPVYSPFPDGKYSYKTAQVAPENGHASHAWIVAAAEAALTGQVDAISTAPIAKEALFAAGFSNPGHTELLASVCGTNIVRMMLVGGSLRVVLQTIHVPLSHVPALISREDIETTLKIVSDFATRMAIYRPRIAVCGLNPHAGEAGHFGNEEETTISPAIENARAEGIDASGPYPGDTVFHRMLQGDFDFVVAMYHDQGLIPVKTLDFNGGVNVTLGLPICRTSPDHGTAFGIVGKNIAHAGSMIAAIKFAADVCRANSA